MPKPLYAISHDHQGSGGFLCPPGHWNHEYTLKGYYGGKRKQEPDSTGGIEYALNPESEASEEVQRRVRDIMARAELRCSDGWVRNVYGYFRNSYAPEDLNRNVSKAIMDPSHSLPPERHLAVLCVREYFPAHEPRIDLIEDPGHGYGSYPCTKCGQRVQYEARADKLVVVKPGERWRYDPACPKGGDHEA